MADWTHGDKEVALNILFTYLFFACLTRITPLKYRKEQDKSSDIEQQVL